MKLTIDHNIYLSKSERYSLHNKKDLILPGVCVPVFINKKESSEPAKEIFCLYHLINKEHEKAIKICEYGFVIHIPFRKGSKPVLDNETYREMVLSKTVEEKYYSKCIKEISSKNLLDVSEGGSNCLHYREYDTIEIDNEKVKVAHYVNIIPIERLIKSLV